MTETPAPRASAAPGELPASASHVPPQQSVSDELSPFWDTFWSQVDASGDCWEWIGRRSTDGYGQLWLTSLQRTMGTHRMAWELLVGPIPAGLHIDHLCRNRACLNPDHLEPVTPAENARRTPYTTTTKCPLGHPYDKANGYVAKDGSRHCRACNRARKRRATQRRRNALGLGVSR